MVVGLAAWLAFQKRRHLSGVLIVGCWKKLWRERGVEGLVLCACILLCGYLFYTHSLAATDEGLISAGISWEDQSGHAMYASSFVHSANLEHLENPHFSGSPLAYPFLCNLLAAVLEQLGSTVGQAFFISGWYAAVCCLLVVFSIARDLLQSGRAASVALILYLFGSGFGFIHFLGKVAGGTAPVEALMLHDYANAWEFGLNYHNVLIAMIVPMRSFSFGLPIAFCAVLLFWRALEAGEKGGVREFATAGVFTGLMPLVNAHTCIVVAWCVLVHLFLTPNPLGVRHLFRIGCVFGLPVVCLALPQLLWTRSQLEMTRPFVQPAFGWMADTESVGTWLSYWLDNGGIRIPLGLLAWWAAGPRLRLYAAPLLGLLLLGNLVAFQPYLYDNVKLFGVADLAIAILITAFFARLLSYSRHWLLFVLPVGFLVVISGLLSTGREVRLRSVVVSWEGVRFAELVRGQSPPRAVFLTSSELTHPVSVLTGRPLVLGYVGWLMNLGIPHEERSAEVKHIFEGGPRADEYLRKYGIEYVVIGPAERREFAGLNEDYIRSRSSQNWVVGSFVLHKVSVPATTTVAHESPPQP